VAARLNRSGVKSAAHYLTSLSDTQLPSLGGFDGIDSSRRVGTRAVLVEGD